MDQGTGMNRFSSLEFGDADKSGSKVPGVPIRNDRYFLDQAFHRYLAGEFEEALRDYSRALEKNSAAFAGWIGQVWMLLELEEYPETLVWADRALELFPEHPDLLAAKAVACLRDARRDKAVEYSDNAVARENTTPYTWLARAEVMVQKKPRIAESCISKALTIAGPQADRFRLEAGRLLSRYRKYSVALEHLRMAIRDFPKSALAWYELGYCQSALGFQQEAIAALEQSQHLRPKWSCADKALSRAQWSPLRRLFHKILRT
jgi:tetratricopeptide (TPR) repeat protein